MDEPESPGERGEDLRQTPRTPLKPIISTSRYGRYVVLLVIVILILITVNTILTKSNGLAGLAPGERMPPFAVPLAQASLEGYANVATRYHEGEAGEVPACSVNEAGALNICKLYGEGPVVLALFIDGGSCTRVLSTMQQLAGSFPQVRFVAVAIGGSHTAAGKLVRSLHLSFPVGWDKDGALAALYKLATCPQLTFALRGGVVQSRALLKSPSAAELRSRVSELAAATAPQP